MPPGSGTDGADHDGDGLSNIDEAALETNPLNPDTSGDGLSDGDEVEAGTDPLDPTGENSAVKAGDKTGNTSRLHAWFESQLATMLGNSDALFVEAIRLNVEFSQFLCPRRPLSADGIEKGTVVLQCRVMQRLSRGER